MTQLNPGRLEKLNFGVYELLKSKISTNTDIDRWNPFDQDVEYKILILGDSHEHHTGSEIESRGSCEI